MATTNYYIDVVPGDMSWDEWNNNVINVLGNQVLPAVPEEEWTMFAAQVVGSVAYGPYDAPSYDNFETWQAWGNALAGCLNGPSYV